MSETVQPQGISTSGDIPERTYTSAELALNQAAILREAANEAVKIAENLHLELGDVESFEEVILAIPTDQPALDKYVAERVREAVLAEAEWWAEYGHSLSDKRARLAAARAPEEGKRNG